MQEERYSDWKEIGKGAFGTVQKAYDGVLKRHVAIKLLKKELLNHDQYPQLLEALHQEVIISRDLRHPNICPIHDIYEGSHGVGTVMDLIDGIELSDWMEKNQGRLLDTAEQRLEILLKLSEALAFAHTHIVHRDLKPDNIFLIQGDPSKPVIMDFGASVVGRDSSDGKIAGTPKYMSPEQWEAPAQVDGRSDLFALGILAYELFTGELPPNSLRKILKTKKPPRVNLDDIPPPSSFCSAVPTSLDRLILQLIAYRQEDRPPTASDVAKSFSEICLKSTEIIPDDGEERFKPKTVSLPGGSFFLGADRKSGQPNELPAKQVVVSPFRIMVYPVTVSEYRRFVQTTGYALPPLLDDPIFGQGDHPVVGVSFKDAMAFAQWVGGSLPTEAQWEYAAKGGEKFPLYPWGDDSPTSTKANIDTVSQATSPVDSCPGGRNPFGLFDLCGNVWEWCLDPWVPDFYRHLKKGDQDPQAKGCETERSLRGGGYDSFAVQGRCASRFHAQEGDRSRSIGFRLVFPSS